MEQIGWCYPSSGGQPKPVKQKEPNDWGLYDTAGNVSEHVWDRYEAQYPAGDTSKPVVDPEGPDSSSYEDRVGRGGDFILPSSYARSARRLPLAAYGAHSTYGFRLVRTKK